MQLSACEEQRGAVNGLMAKFCFWIVNPCLEWSEKVNSVLSLITRVISSESSDALWLIVSTDSASLVDLGATEFPWCMMRVSIVHK